MNRKDFVRQYWATTAMTLRLTQRYYRSRKQIVADNWFDSLKRVSELMNRAHEDSLG